MWAILFICEIFIINSVSFVIVVVVMGHRMSQIVKTLFKKASSWSFSCFFSDSVKHFRVYWSKGGSRTVATSKMELFVTIVNGWKPLTIITKSSILDVAAVLFLQTFFTQREFKGKLGVPRVLRHSKGTWVLQGYLDTPRTLGHSRYFHT